MLIFKKIIINNFGPYQNHQTIEFPDNKGVIIVWGNNGYGKTTLLNCFRYALWGTIYNRNETAKNICAYVNTEAISRGDDMSVELHMCFDEHNYILTRTFKRLNNTLGNRDTDYDNFTTLRRDQSILSPNETEHFLKTVLPEKISRFYLFDGELLSEYEALLDNNDTSIKIKTSIEDILGFPILQNCCYDVQTIRQEYDNIAVKVSAKLDSTKMVSRLLDKEIEKTSNLKKGLSELCSSLESQQTELGKINLQLKNTESYRSTMSKISSKNSLISNINDRITKRIADLAILLDEAWKVIIAPLISELIEKKTKEKDILTEKKYKIDKKEVYKEIFNEICSGKITSCPICNAQINKDSISYINKRIDDLIKSDDVSFSEEEYNALLAEINQLKGYISNSDKKQISTFINDINEDQINISLLKNEILGLEKKKKNIKPEIAENELSQLIPKRDEIKKSIECLEKGIQDANKNISESENNINIYKTKIAKSENADVKKTMSDLKTCENIQDIFESCIESFRQKKKKDIEKDASNIL